MAGSKLPSLFFCQSIKDFAIIDELISRKKNYKKNSQINYIVFVGQQATYRFAKSLYFDRDNIICLYLNIYGFKKDFLQLRSLLNAKKALNTLQVEFNRIYFFSNLFDHISFYLMGKITFNKLIFIDYFQITRSRSQANIFTMFKIFIINLIFQERVICLEDQILETNIQAPHRYFPISDFNHKSPNKNSVPLSNDNKNYALFYDNGDLNFRDLEILSAVYLILLDQEITLYIKTHPLHQTSPLILSNKHLKELIFKSNAPSEFLDFSNIPIGITKTSAALTDNHELVISIIRMQNKFKKIAYNYLKNKNKLIQFPSSIDDLKSLLKSNSF